MPLRRGFLNRAPPEGSDDAEARAVPGPARVRAEERLGRNIRIRRSRFIGVDVSAFRRDVETVFSRRLRDVARKGVVVLAVPLAPAGSPVAHTRSLSSWTRSSRPAHTLPPSTLPPSERSRGGFGERLLLPRAPCRACSPAAGRAAEQTERLTELDWVSEVRPFVNFQAVAVRGDRVAVVSGLGLDVLPAPLAELGDKSQQLADDAEDFLALAKKLRQQEAKPFFGLF